MSIGISYLCLCASVILLVSGNSTDVPSQPNRLEPPESYAVLHNRLVKEAQSFGITDLEEQFEKFKETYNKTYKSNNLLLHHKKNFLESYRAVLENNREFEKGNVSYRLRLNKFADKKLIHPIKSSLLDLKNVPKHSHGNLTDRKLKGVSLPAYFDWRDLNVVTPVGDQGECGSCYIFAGTALIETANGIVGNPLVSLSKQHPLDCISIAPQGTYDSDGCDGGTVADVFKFSKENGIPSDHRNPYFGIPLGSCGDKSDYYQQKVTKWKMLDMNPSDEKMMETIFVEGPVSTIINSDDNALRLYEKGVITTKGSSNLETDANHYLVLVGWGSENGIDYWIVKNSWGEDWGEDGFFRMKRGINSHGMNTVVSYARAEYNSDVSQLTTCDYNGTGCGAFDVRSNANFSIFIITLLVLISNWLF